MEYVAVLAWLLSIVCFVTAVLDWGLNSEGAAAWAPWGFGLALAAVVVAGLCAP